MKIKFLLLLALAAVSVGWGAQFTSGTYTVGTGQLYAHYSDFVSDFNTRGPARNAFIDVELVPPDTSATSYLQPDSMRNSTIRVHQRNFPWGDPTSQNRTYGSSYYFFDIRGVPDTGTLIIEQIYYYGLSNNPSTGFAYFSVAPGTNSKLAVIIRDNMITGKDGTYKSYGITATSGLNKVSFTIINNKFWNLKHTIGGITWSITTAGPRTLIANNTIYDCYSGIGCVNSSMYAYHLYINNICINNANSDFLNTTLNTGGCNFSSDSSCANYKWSKLLGHPIGNQVMMGTSIFLSVDTNSADFLKLNPAYRSLGTYDTSGWYYKYVNGVLFDPDSVDPGCSGILRNAKPDTSTIKVLPAGKIPWTRWNGKVQHDTILKKLEYGIVIGNDSSSGYLSVSPKTTLNNTTYGSGEMYAKRIPAANDSLNYYMSPRLTKREDFYKNLNNFGVSDSLWNISNVDTLYPTWWDSAYPTPNYHYLAWGGNYVSKENKYLSTFRTGHSQHGYDTFSICYLYIHDIDSNNHIVRPPSAIIKIWDTSPRFDSRSPLISGYEYEGKEYIWVNRFFADSILNGGIDAKYSTDGGNTWSNRITIQEYSVSQYRHQMPIIKLSNDTLCLGAYVGANLTNDSIYMFYAACSSPDIWNKRLITNNTAYQLNEVQIIEVKTGSIYQGQMYAFIRSENDVTYYTHYFISSDYGHTWSAGGLNDRLGSIMNMRSPFGISKSKDGTTISMYGGQQGYGSKWGCSYLTFNNFITVDALMFSSTGPWMHYIFKPPDSATGGRYYPQSTDFNNCIGCNMTTWSINKTDEYRDGGGAKYPPSYIGTNYQNTNVNQPIYNGNGIVTIDRLSPLLMQKVGHFSSGLTLEAGVFTQPAGDTIYCTGRAFRDSSSDTAYLNAPIVADTVIFIAGSVPIFGAGCKIITTCSNVIINNSGKTLPTIEGCTSSTRRSPARRTPTLKISVGL